jgi:GNAT superfamily N-acetyltransferase
LNDLFVVPDARRRGVGTRLLRRAREFARDAGAEYLTLETARDNPAQKLYEADGWKLDTQFLHYEREP